MYRFIKRLVDIIIGLIALPFVLLLIIIVGLLIKIEDRGPIFYCAKRLGKNGKIFKMIKFRSMKVNAPVLRSADGQLCASDSDSRITKIGKILRKTSIDEIPQFINVLKGDMTLIGPRAHMITDKYKGYDALSDVKKKRLRVKPGITGYNQAYFRNSVSADQKDLNDCYYVDNMSLWMDIKIIFKTIATVLGGKNLNTNTKRIMVLGASYLQVPLLQEAKKLGYYVAVLDMNPEAIGIQYADEFFNVSTIDVEAILQVANEFKPDGIVTAATDMPMRAIGKVNDELKLNGIGYEVAINATDKFEMIKKFKEYNVPSPWFIHVSNEADLEKEKNSIEYPCIMKPVDSSGSRGVSLINSYEELCETFDYSKKHAKNGVLIEEYMQGNEISVEVLIQDSNINIITITDKITSGSPHFVELGHIQPTSLPRKIVNQVYEVVNKAIKAIGITDGAAHVEIMVTENGPKLIELGARLGGDFITSHLVPLSTGVNMLENVIKISCGEKINCKKKFNKVAIVKFLKFENGILESVSGVEETLNIKGVKEAKILRIIDEEIGNLESSTDRDGYIIIQASSRKKAEKIYKKALKKIIIKIKEK